MNEIEQRVKSIIVEKLGVEEDEVTKESTLMEDLGADSLDAVELGMAIEDAVGVAIADEDLPNIKTVQDLVDYVESHQ